MLHLVQAFVALGLYLHARPKVNVDLVFNYAVWSNGTATNTNGTSGIVYLQTPAGSINLMGLVIGFFFLSAVFQLGPALFGWDSYWRNVQHGIQPWRWVEYAFSASLLLWVALLLDGVTDLHLLLLAFAANFAVMFLGYLQEIVMLLIRRLPHKGDAPSPRWLAYVAPHALGWVLHIFLWAILFQKFYLAVNHGPADVEHHVPTAVKALYPLLFLLFSCFAGVQIYQMVALYGVGADNYEVTRVTMNAEYVYTSLSLTTKTVLAWVFYGGVGAYSNHM